MTHEKNQKNRMKLHHRAHDRSRRKLVIPNQHKILNPTCRLPSPTSLLIKRRDELVEQTKKYIQKQLEIREKYSLPKTKELFVKKFLKESETESQKDPEVPRMCHAKWQKPKNINEVETIFDNKSENKVDSDVLSIKKCKKTGDQKSENKIISRTEQVLLSIPSLPNQKKQIPSKNSVKQVIPQTQNNTSSKNLVQQKPEKQIISETEQVLSSFSSTPSKKKQISSQKALEKNTVQTQNTPSKNLVPTRSQIRAEQLSLNVRRIIWFWLFSGISTPIEDNNGSTTNMPVSDQIT